MKKEIIISLLTLLGAVLGSMLFWKAHWGVNTLVFSILLIALLIHTKAEILEFRYGRIIALGMVLASFAVTLHNHALSKTVFSLSVILVIGFSQVREIRFLYYGFLLAWFSWLETPRSIIEHLRSLRIGSGKKVRFTYWFGIIVAPLIVTSLFFAIYVGANPKFAASAAYLLELFEQFFRLFRDWNFQRFWHFLFFLWLIWSILWSSKRLSRYYNREQGYSFLLFRKRHPETLSMGTLALKGEYRMGLVTLGLLNALLFFVNMTDLRFVWMDYGNFTAPELKQFVHAGTYMLILAILMAIAVLLYFFRKNLNFYPNNTLLKQLAYAWLIQNALLVLSVSVRNFQYVHHYGLTYKRVGVFVFLLLVLFGLWTVFRKISIRKTAYFLLFRNSWAIYFAILAMSLVNWDMLITRYNLRANTVEGIGVSYLVNKLSYTNIDLLEANEELLMQHNKRAKKMISRKRQRLQEKLVYYPYNNWRSWNWSDHKNRKGF